MTNPSSNNGYQQIRTLGAIMALVLLALHFYYSCYQAFEIWHLTNPFINRLVINISHSGLFKKAWTAKLFALVCILLTLAGPDPHSGNKGKSRRSLIIIFVVGTFLYFGNGMILMLEGDIQVIAVSYFIVSLIGFGLLYSCAGAVVSKMQWRMADDVFNTYNQSFPQEERLISTPYSVNLKARYLFRGKYRNSWINIIQPFRSTLICANPGAGKSRFLVRQILQTHLEKNFTAFVYDFKFDDLTRIAYNTLENIRPKLKINPTFYVINFDDLSRSNRCNPLDPATMFDISDASESSKTILLALNREWIRRQGDFFVDSAITFVTANIWFLRKFENGKYCSLPHLIELIQCDYTKLFSVLRSFREIESLINTFLSAFLSNSMDQLEGQVASARIALSSLSSPQLYWVLSANDFTLDINNPEAPKVVCMGSNPQKQQTYGAVLSLYVARMIRLINKKGCLPCTVIFDEFPTLYSNGMDNFLATCRANKVATTICIQDLSQLRKDYGNAQADALFNLPANFIFGQVMGETAKLASERHGKILQRKSSISTNSRDSSMSQSTQLDAAVPPSRISSLSAGEFVGMVADDPSERIKHKGFDGEIMMDHAAVDKEEGAYKDRPIIQVVTPEMVEFNSNKIKDEVRSLVEARLDHMIKTPSLARLIVKKPEGNSKRQAP